MQRHVRSYLFFLGALTLALWAWPQTVGAVHLDEVPPGIHVDEITYQSSRDGLKLYALIYTPAAYDPAQPALPILWVHGCPRGCSNVNSGELHAVERFIKELPARLPASLPRQVVVISPNFRGSIQMLDDGALFGGEPVIDEPLKVAFDIAGLEIYDCLDALDTPEVRALNLDWRHLIMGGASGGGARSWLAAAFADAAHKPALLLSITGPYDLVFAWETGLEKDRQLLENFFGGPPTDPAIRPRYVARSPTSFARDLQGVIVSTHHATGDPRVNIGHSDLGAQALRNAGVQFTQYKYQTNSPNAHGFWTAVNHPQYPVFWNNVFTWIAQKITANDPPPNRPPVMQPPGTHTVTVGETFTLDLRATDPDGNLERIRFRPWPPPAGSTWDVREPGHVHATWTPTADQVGTHTFSVIAEDAEGLRDTESLVITVAAPAPTVDHPPTIDALRRSYSLRVGQPFALHVTGRDVDHDLLRLMAHYRPQDSIWVSSPARGVVHGTLRWIPQQPGIYRVRFVAKDISKPNGQRPKAKRDVYLIVQ